MIVLSPSLLACDFANLEREILKVYSNGCEYLHLDIMDGVFVNNISFGLPIIASIRKICGAVFDVHLMIANPIRYITQFAETGADIINFHVEACESDDEIFATLELIGKCEKKRALAIKPSTSVETLTPFLELLDMVLVMSVEPGFGGQAFMESSLEKISWLRDIKREKSYKFDIQVDGGVNLENITRIKQAGANIIVAGSTIFGANENELKSVIDTLKS